MPENFAAVHGVLPGETAAKPFGMPLQADDGKRMVNNSLRHSICSVLNDRKRKTAGPESALPAGHQDSLVMGAVYRKITAVQFKKKGIFFCMGGMKLVIL